jgi:hypothetical protein
MENADNIFKTEFHGDYISVSLGPDYEPDENEKDLWIAIKAACEQFECDHVLLDGMVPKHLPKMTDAMESGVRVADVAPNLWFAVCLEGALPPELTDVFKAVARSRGVHVKIFDDHDHAISWLRSNPDLEPTLRPSSHL